MESFHYLLKCHFPFNTYPIFNGFTLNYCNFKGVLYLGLLPEFLKNWVFRSKLPIFNQNRHFQQKWQFGFENHFFYEKISKNLWLWVEQKFYREFLTWIFGWKFLTDINWSTLLRRHTSYKIFFLTCALLSDLLCHLILKSRHFRNAINFIRIYVFLCKIQKCWIVVNSLLKVI